MRSCVSRTERTPIPRHRAFIAQPAALTRLRLPTTGSFFVLLLCLAAAASAENEAPWIAERVLAVVDERPLLLSEVRAVEAVRGLGRPQALEASIDERLMFQEASRLPQAAVSDENAGRALRALLETRPELEALPTAQLRRLIRRQAAILQYVDFRFRPQVRITEEVLRAAWNEEFRGQPEGPPFEEAAPALRARLERGALDERIEDWVRRLRERAEVRYVEGPGSPPPPEDP